jgi:acyl-CoA reductase-like NAD-dependent aldehyde dehydrogenase
MDDAAELAVEGAHGEVWTTGQRCTAASRAKVQDVRKVYDMFPRAASNSGSKRPIKVNGHNPRSTSIEAVPEYIEIGKKKARFVIGGRRYAEEIAAKGSS